jgi:MSHA biogenesis protein MshJ
MKRYWERVRDKIDGMSLRERAIIFLAMGFVLVALVHAVLLDPLLARQKVLTAQMVQQQEKMKALQAQIQALVKARDDNQRSPLRARLAQLGQQLQAQDSYMQSRHERLVDPDRMAALLEQVLNKNGKLQLLELKTLSASPLVEPPQPATGAAQAPQQKQIFKHGIRVSVRGAYLDMLGYLDALEKMPAQMFWGEIDMKVDQYPDAILTLTLYTLSMDKAWLTI